MRYALVFGVFLLSLAVTPLALLARPATGAGIVVVVLPPWMDADTLLTQAGGRVVGPERAPLGVLAQVETVSALKKLRHLGAWAVMDGAALAELCGVDDV